jgi:hypothetical protein
MSREGAVSRRIHESEDLPNRFRKNLVEMANPQADIIGLGFFYSCPADLKREISRWHNPR